MQQTLSLSEVESPSCGYLGARCKRQENDFRRPAELGMGRAIGEAGQRRSKRAAFGAKSLQTDGQ